MKANVLNRIVGATCIAAAFLLSACGDDDKASTCPEGQALVSVDGAAQCAAECNAGVCGAGLICNAGYCVPTAGTNNPVNNVNNPGNNPVNNTNNTNNPPNNTNNPPNNTNNPPNNTNNTNNPPNNPPNNPTCQPSSIQGACDIICQTGCQPGQACVISGGTPEAPQTGCVAAGTGMDGAVCMGPCAAGYQCIPESEGATSGTCVKFCREGGPTCTAPETCAPLVQDLSAGICAVPEDDCTQYPNDSCPAGENCFPTQLGLQCLPFKADANAGDTCTGPTQCNDNQACAGAQGAPSATCQNKCDPAAPQCAQGEQCLGLTVNGQPSGYGVCATM